MNVVEYTDKHKIEWDRFVGNAKNSVFLFNRDYMEYHSDRFVDYSLMFFDDGGKLVALFPASRDDNKLVSHGGLTFGGIVSDKRMTTPRMLEIFTFLKEHAHEAGITSISYKAVPHIYHSLPAEEDLYALFINDARTIKREVSSTINMARRLPFSKGRKYSISKARKADVVVRESSDYKTFMRIEEEVLREQHGTKPVHTAEEMMLLASRFPENIRLFSAEVGGEIHAGIIMYVGGTVAHAQYMAADQVARECGALDMIVNVLVNEVFADIPFFDFGISTENAGQHLNQGLIAQKEMFGARAVIHETYEMCL